MSVSDQQLSQVHYRIISGLINNGYCPDNLEIAQQLGIEIAQLDQILQALAAIHGLVLQPASNRPWIVHPFSLMPTLNWVSNNKMGWWSPCIWCAFGIANLVGGEVTINTRIASEDQAIKILVKDGQPVDNQNLLIHFAIPPINAWQNVHFHCALVLPFESVSQIDQWCQRHRLPRGEAVTMAQVTTLAKIWYGRHADPDWRKWTMTEAQQIFRQADLISEFWYLGDQTGKF